MILENINNTPGQRTVLVAPLDWGLGHATRCIPIIHALMELKISVVLAASGSTAIILQNEFPTVRILHLEGYNITYGQTKSSFRSALLTQVPGIIRSIRRERRWLVNLLKSEQFDAVISDNRFGMSHPHLPSVYITHQLNIQTGNNLLNWIAQRIHYHFINRFSECWVPDQASAQNMGALLSHPVSYPAVPVKYVGLLSRFKKIPSQIDISLLIILSGPEPQRSILEAILLEQLNEAGLKAVLVRGLPSGPSLNTSLYPNVVIYNYVPAVDLSTLIQRSEMLISRCGYSTVMDLALLWKKAVLVPTPGQTEQEYLASYLHQKGYFFTCSQEGFDLTKCIREAARFHWQSFPDWREDYQKVISNFINTLPNRLI